MKNLIADYINDPENDFDLMIEILDGEREIACIRKVNGEYSLIVYENDVNIPIKWLNEIISKL
ncbi:MAG: hypothetical protein ACRC7N_10340 [Clostridium sp.]